MDHSYLLTVEMSGMFLRQFLLVVTFRIIFYGTLTVKHTKTHCFIILLTRYSLFSYCLCYTEYNRPQSNAKLNQVTIQ